MNILEEKGISLWSPEKRLKTHSDPRYKQVNDIWMKNGFNKRNYMGYCIDLIKSCNPSTLADWEKFYLKSGEDAYQKKQLVLQQMEKGKISQNDGKELICHINSNSGKCYSDMVSLAETFQDKLQKNGIERSLEECFNYIYVKAIEETWIGYLREKAVEESLKTVCESLGCYLKESDTILDIKYGVDYEIYKKDTDELMCGIQVKGFKYFLATLNPQKAEALQHAILISKMSHKHYEQDFGAKVAFVYVHNDGTCDRRSIRKVQRELGYVPRLAQQIKEVSEDVASYNNLHNVNQREIVRNDMCR